MPRLAEFPGDPLQCKKMIRNADKIFEFIGDIIDEHVREYDENDIEDFTSAYIKEMKRKQLNEESTTMSCNYKYISNVFSVINYHN
jgi:hypothetical protein